MIGASAYGAAACGILILTGVLDARTRRVNLGLIALAVAAAITWHWLANWSFVSPLAVGASAIAGGGAMLLLSRAAPIGGGDAVMMASAGVLSGPMGLVLAFLGACLSIVWAARQSPRRRRLVPLGPGIAAGAILPALLALVP